MQHTTVKNLVVTMITSTVSSSSSTSRLCVGGKCGIYVYMEYVYLVYILGHEVYIKSTPHKFSGFAKVFFFLLSLCYFPETDNPSLVTCSLNKCTFTNSQTRFCISMQALVCVLPMSKQCDSFHIFREATAVSGCQKEERCVPVSTLERDTVLSTFLATAGSKQGM